MKSFYLAVALAGALAGQTYAQTTSSATSAAPEKTVATQGTSPEYKGRPGSPFSEAVRVGEMIYLSGVLGTDASGKLAAGGIKAETKQVMDNIRAILERNNSGMDRVVKCTVMILDIAERPAMSEVYVTYFPKDRMPARSTFGTTGLALGARVEIECMATVK
ncbi:MAG TPA: RidA family protein [Pyrinomonadaceae bacterium]|nr:RidA family protein [Pyrinomonadaceae bacterium]